MSTDARPKNSRRRGLGVGALVAIGCVLLALGSLAVWLDYTLLNTDEYTETVAPLPAEPAVADALSGFVVDEVLAETDAEAQLTSALQRDLGTEAPSVSGAVVSGIESSARRVVDEFLVSSEFETVWREANRDAHELAIAAIKGDDSGVLESRDGRVELNLKPLVDQVAADVSGSAGVNVSVPDDVARIQLFRDGELATAQAAANVLEALSWVLPVLALLLFAIAISLSRDRWRTLAGVGVGAIVVALLTIVVLRFARAEVVEGVADPDLPGPAVAAIWDTLIRNLETQTWVLLALGVIAASAGALMGRSSWAASFRASLVQQARSSGGAGGLQRAAREHTGLLRTAGVAVGVVLLLIWSEPSIVAGIVIVALTVLYLAGVEILRRGSPPAVTS